MDFVEKLQGNVYPKRRSMSESFFMSYSEHKLVLGKQFMVSLMLSIISDQVHRLAVCCWHHII